MKRRQSTPQQEALARKRAELIIQVRSGLMKAQDAANQMGSSRKTYYKWEERALAAMIEALIDQPVGRPPTPSDPQTETLQQQAQQLQDKVQVLEQTLAIREALDQPAKKKTNEPW